MTRKQQSLIIRLWKDWCRVWPAQYGHNSLDVHSDGYDPVFDVIPAQTYKDFYYEVVRGHPNLRTLNAFEVIDCALNEIRAPETPVVRQERSEPQRAEAHELETAISEEAYEVTEMDAVELTSLPEMNVVEVEMQPVRDRLGRPLREADIA
ncbi:MAG: hypothetical protein AAF529_18730 [Pseudomonadota bacterium]